MKKIAKKVYKNISFGLIILFVGILSGVNEFNFMNYSFFINKYIFIIISLMFIVKLTINKNKIKEIDLDNKYLFNLHILLNIIWIFLFFLYRNTYISLFVILSNVIILFLLYKTLLSKYKVFNIFYGMWFIYLVVVNILII